MGHFQADLLALISWVIPSTAQELDTRNKGLLRIEAFLDPEGNIAVHQSLEYAHRWAEPSVSQLLIMDYI